KQRSCATAKDVTANLTLRLQSIYVLATEPWSRLTLLNRVRSSWGETPNELASNAILRPFSTVSTQIFLGAVPRTAGRRLRPTRESFRSQSPLARNYDERQHSAVAGGPPAIFKVAADTAAATAI